MMKSAHQITVTDKINTYRITRTSMFSNTINSMMIKLRPVDVYNWLNDKNMDFDELSDDEAEFMKTGRTPQEMKLYENRLNNIRDSGLIS